jgi:biopolymer transport protein ExbD
MRLAGKKTTEVHEGDLTPMIDMTFQLIAFFMVLINFTQSEQDQRVQLPDSSLARPAEKPLDHPIIIHIAEDGEAIYSGQKVPIADLGPHLQKEIYALEFSGDGQESATIVLRAHRHCQAGRVQELIQNCQEMGFENFALRATENVESTKYLTQPN